MYFLPDTLVAQQAHMEALVPVLFGRDDKVDDTLRLLFEDIREERIDMETDSLLILLLLSREDESYHMSVVQMLEVASRSLQFPPNAVRLSVPHLRACTQTMLTQQLHDACRK